MNGGKQGLAGLRVLSLESRRAAEMSKLIENHGGTVVSAPSLREIPLEDNRALFDFGAMLLAGHFDAVLFLTGIGARTMFSAVEPRYSRQQMVEALSKKLVIVRGPKPAAVMREYGVPIAIAVPEPNTWRDILKALDEHQPPIAWRGMRLAMQEYGVANRDLVLELEARGVAVTAVPVYRWEMPENLEPLRQASREAAAGRIEVLLVTSAMQVIHLMQVAAEMGLEEAVRRALRRAAVATVGPIAAEAVESCGIPVDFQASHPKMGVLVFEAAQKAREVLGRKRGM